MTAAAQAADDGRVRAPRLMRRLACLVYEGVLLFGVVMVVGLVYGLATNQRHALNGANGLKATLFVVLGIYFVYFWSRHGQTLAMKTWNLRLADANGRAPSAARSLLRYLLAWLWFLPALALVSLSGLKSGGATAAIVTTGVLTYAGLALLRADRQFFHDVVCGTRVLDTRGTPTAMPAPDPARESPQR